MVRKDPYEILGVTRNASQDEIKRAYRKLAKLHHPDRNRGNKSAEQRFKEIQAAYEVLGDPQRREQYDRFGEGGPPPDMSGWTSVRGAPFDGVHVDFGNGTDFSDIINEFFQRGAGRVGRRRTTGASRRARGADLEHAVDLTLEEVARGCVRELRLSGGETGEEHVSFRIPAGVADGQVVRVRGKGHPGPAGRGDLLIRCRVLPHAYFRRDGQNILLDLPLTFSEAALGARIEIPTLSGPTWLTVPPGTSSGAKLRLRGKGLPAIGKHEAGDMFAVVKIVAPRRVTPRGEELLRALEAELAMNPRRETGWTL